MAASGRNVSTIDAEEILGRIRRWVEIETPSRDAVAVNRLADIVADELAAVGAATSRVPGRDGYGDIVEARMPWGGDGPGILVLCHLDTVHPHGTLERLPFRLDGDRVYGPGIYDMKGGACLALEALRQLVRAGTETPLPVTLLFMPDEEVGSPTSRAVIEAAARNAKYVLVTEPARDGGKIVTGRKGSARFRITAHGRPSHAGLRHQDGRSAIREMARLVLAIEGLTDYARGVTTNVGTIEGGTGTNVVPARCTIEVDARMPDPEAAEALLAAIRGLTPADPDIRLEIEGGLNRPPYAKDAGIEALYGHARGLAAELGFDLPDTTSGGGSDGNFTAALGVPTLDGLGVDGAGAHTEDEHLYYSSLVPRTALLMRLLETLE